MATFTSLRHGSFTEDAFQRYLDGELRSVSTSEIVFDGRDSYSYKAVFSGSFQTSAGGQVAGTITDFIYFYRSTAYTFVTIEGADMPAERTLGLIARDRFAQLAEELAGGSDLVDGSTIDTDFMDTPPLSGHSGNDTILGSSRNDELHGGDGCDLLSAGAGDDLLLGGKGSDRLLGEWGDDALSGEQGNDVLRGSYGDDTLNGGGGRDRLIGQAGADTLDGGAGNDRMKGGGGADLFVFSAGNDKIADFRTAGRKEVIDLSATDISNFAT
jgi:Ca2+-binding RTX toxin-like protein